MRRTTSNLNLRSTDRQPVPLAADSFSLHHRDGPTTKPLNSHRDTIVAGFVVWAIFLVVMIVLFTS